MREIKGRRAVAGRIIVALLTVLRPISAQGTPASAEAPNGRCWMATRAEVESGGQDSPIKRRRAPERRIGAE